MIQRVLATGPLNVNCYIIGCEETREAAVIDPGGNADEITGALLEDRLALRKILLTHGHWDHIGAVGDLKRLHACETFLHDGDLVLYGQAPEYARMFGFEIAAPPDPDGELDDGQRIEVGSLTMDVIHTPGHTEGSVTFSLSGILYTGDLIFAGAVGRTDLPGGDQDALARSVRERIFHFPDETKIMAGHGPSTTVGEERAGADIWF